MCPSLPGIQSAPLARPSALPAQAEPLRAEYERARAGGLPLAVLALQARLPRALETDEALRERALAALLGLLREAPRPGGLVALQGSTAVFALLTRAGLEEARSFGDALIARSFALAVPGLDPRLGLAPCLGIAIADPRQPHALETLLAVAIEGACVARARGGACSAHTELYALCSERLGREGAASLAPCFPRTTLLGQPSPALRLPDQAPSPRPHAPASPPQASATPAPPARPAPALAPSPARKELSPETARPAPATPPAGSDEVELLERRIAKLVAALEESERKLARLERVVPTDTGVASIYREVQGLDGADEQYALKNELMGKLLEANLALRACIQAQSGSAA